MMHVVRTAVQDVVISHKRFSF